MKVSEIEKIIGIKATEWKGRCYEIACEMIKHDIVLGRAVHGMYFGEIVKTSIFYNPATPFARHGWIETPNGNIIDPTRWVFEDEEPYIYTGNSNTGEYDEGSSVLRELLQQPKPDYNPDSKQLSIPSGAQGDSIRLILLLEQGRESISIEEAFWLANCPLKFLSNQAEPIYHALTDMGLKAFIPADHQVKVFELKMW